MSVLTPAGGFCCIWFIQRGFFTLLTASQVLCFTAFGTPLAARRIRILPMNQHSYAPRGKQRTGRREPVNKIEKLSVYPALFWF
jgi:hypothetical protein